jgi:predicted MFS family arabinose efflux permease
MSEQVQQELTQESAPAGGSWSSQIFYGWIVVGVTTVVLLVSAGVRSAPGVFLLPVQTSLGVDRTTVAFSVSLGLLLYGAAGPLSGWLMNRLGLRRLAALGLALTAAGMVLCYGVTQPWQLALVWGVLSGIGTGIVGSVLGAAVAARWFVARRGLVVGIFGAAMSAGQLIFVPLLMTMASSVGWRLSSVLLGLVAAAVILPAVLLLRNDPADLGLRPYGVAPSSAPVRAAVAVAGVMRQAVRTRAFWLLAITFFICGATSNGLIGTHLIPYAVECGIPQAAAAGSLALLGAMNFVGTLLSGVLTDRYDPRKLLFVYYGLRGLSLLLLPFVRDPLGLSIFAAVFGLDYIATVPPTTSLIAERFGRAQVGVVYGWVFFAHQLGAASAAWLGGVARDGYGDYTLAFLTAGVVAITAGVLALGIRTQATDAPATAA